MRTKCDRCDSVTAYNEELKAKNDRLQKSQAEQLKIAQRIAEEIQVALVEPLLKERDELKAKVQELENERDQWND